MSGVTPPTNSTVVPYPPAVAGILKPSNHLLLLTTCCSVGICLGILRFWGLLSGRRRNTPEKRSLLRRVMRNST